jgi:Nif-specific regulatory protein
MESAQQKALIEIPKIINSILDKQPLLEKVMDVAAEALNAERGFLVLCDRPGSGIRVEVARNISDSLAHEIALPSSSVVNQVLQTNEALIVHEPVSDPRFREAASIILQKVTAIACVPLVLRGRTIGVIYLDSSTNRAMFHEGIREFLTAFADYAAIAIENAEAYENLKSQKELLQFELERTYGFPEIIGNSPKMQAVFEIMRKILNSDITVLLEGESGTGKEMVARAIHYNSHRKGRPFVAQFCGNLSENLLESELFGHKKGSFTGAVCDKKGLFEIADGGTFFLDEIADISPTIQAKLLRVLQEGTFRRVGDTEDRRVDVRIISATNKSLRTEVKKGNFRDDLFYRLNVISITMPPLRERRSDIRLLVAYFLRKIAQKTNRKSRTLSAEALRALTNYHWPGNVRELENTIERAVVLAGDVAVIGLDDLIIPEAEAETLTPRSLKEQEKEIVLKTLQECEGNKTKTAEILGVSLRWLHYKLNEWQTGKVVREGGEELAD